MKKTLVVVGVSGRHTHLTKESFEKLFGKGAKLEMDRKIFQPGQFLAKQRLEVKGPKRSLDNVAIVGPVRDHDDVELTLTDVIRLGMSLGKKQARGILTRERVKLIGPAGEVELDFARVTIRHLHASPQDAQKLGLADGDTVSIQTKDGPRRLVFEKVLVRVDEKFKLEFQVDTDEANAALLKTGDEVFVIKGQCLF